MKNLSYRFMVIVCLFTACKKKDVIPNPEADFSIATVDATALTIGTGENYSLVNNSKNSTSYSWDLGNGTKATTKDATVNFASAGTYNITLTATNSEGVSVSIKKTVTALTRKLKKIVIKNLDWNAARSLVPSLPAIQTADIWFEIVKGENGVTYPVLPNGSFNAPVIYKSQLLTGVASTTANIEINVSDNVPLFPDVLLQKDGYKGIGYGFNFYARQGTDTVLLSSTFFSGIAIKYQQDIVLKSASVNTNYPFQVEYQYKYE